MRAAAWSSWLMLAVSTGVSGCGSSTTPPLVRVAQSPEAQREFAALQVQWDKKERVDTGALESRLRSFSIVYSDDPMTPLADAYLAILLTETGRSKEALPLLAKYANEPPGATRDLMTVVRAHRLRKDGDAAGALALLRPLAGKMIDSDGRALVLEELVLGAVASRADYEAIGYLDAWLVGTSGQEHARAIERVKELLGRLSSTVLEGAYRSMRAQGKKSGYSVEIRTLVAERLSDLAVLEGNTELARWLLDPKAGPTPSSLGSQVELGDLASSHRGQRSVQGRAVGLLLPSSSLDRSGEASDVLRGLSFALGLPASTSIRLVVREAGVGVKRVQDALEELAGEGVAVVVAGFDVDTAGRALEWGDASNIVVIALNPPPTQRTLRHGFVIGEEPSRELAELGVAWRRDQRLPATFLSQTRTPDYELRGMDDPPVEVAHPCEENDREAAFLRETAGTTSYWVSGPEACTADLFHHLARQGRIAKRGGVVSVGTTLGSYAAEIPAGLRVQQTTITAGLIPVQNARSVTAPAELVRYVKQYGAAPNYWSALGYDAGVLTRAALAPLPADSTKSDQEVYLRRAIVEAGLLAARASLWSTEARGFERERSLPRRLGSLQIAARK